MEARALIRGITMSPRKMRVVANLVRGERVEAAVGLLEHMPKKAGRLIAKAIKSAAANAEERSGGDVSVEDLKISTITVDGGPIVKRWMPRSMGRANRIQHRTSHLTVVVSDE
ncbi:MAG TPA: 50S ribosomal protein L22 [Kofleriaceae bacterium]|nr:50S ribosomal protein L22 [Kofleriaceae bacterium]